MTSLPDFLTEQTEEAIMLRMLEKIPSDMDKNQGSYIWDALSPAAIELAQTAIWAQEVLRRGFAATTYGEYLDLRCQEHGLTRRSAVKASGQVTFTGEAATPIPKGTRVSTIADSDNISVSFETTSAAAIAPGGTVTVNVMALEAGIKGNVAAYAVSLPESSISGISGVFNETATTGGLDTENDPSLLARYLQKVRSPSAGGNKADYINWAMEVPGVGGVSVIPVRYGPGSVSLSLIDSGKGPAGQELVDAVQDYIAPPWSHNIEAETMSLEGGGISVDETQEDDTGSSVKLVYDAVGEGAIIDSELCSLLEKPGVWQARVRVKVDNDQGITDLLSIGVWNTATGTWAKTSGSSSADALLTLQGSNLETSFEDVVLEFYWNGVDPLELMINRKQSDSATTVWVDSLVYRSAFSKDTGEGKAPIGAKVTVERATPVIIDVSVSLSISAGYNIQNVRNAVELNIDNYLKSLAFTVDNDVRYVRIGQVILDTPGVQDYSDLLINNDDSNIPVGIQEVAVKGTVTLL